VNTHQLIMLGLGLLLSVLVAVSVELSGRGLAVGWLVGLCVRVCWVLVALATNTWTLIIGPVIVGPRFWKNWRRWHARDVAKRTPSDD
jgi:hypothetical protein